MNKFEISSIKTDSILDTSGALCPLPIINTKKRISELTFGDTLLVIATDPSFVLDCRVFIGQTGHILLQSWQEAEKFYFVLQKNTG